MKQGTKVGWILVAFSLLLSVWVMAGSGSRASEVTTSDGFTVTDAGILSAYNGTATDIVIPSSVTIDGNEVAVQTISANAFRGNTSITSVTVPNSVSAMESASFQGCTALTTANLSSSSLTEIPANAFDGCTALTTVTLPSTLTTISSLAFNNTSLSAITIPASVTSIATNAFTNCSGLQSFTVESGNQYYASDAQGILYNANMTMLILVPGGYSGKVTIPDDVLSIGADAFQKNQNITTVTIPSSVTTINPGAFSGTKIDNITVPESVTSIGTQSDWNPTTVYAVPNSDAWNFFQNLGTGNGVTKVYASGDDGGSSSYTVSFDLNGGAGTFADQTVAANGYATEPTTTPTRSGYTFDGWYYNGTLFDFVNTPITASITLTAMWTSDGSAATTYTVTFNSNGGAETFASQTVTAGSVATNPGSPTRSGYTFNGWYNGSTKYVFSTAVTSDLTLTAKWTANSSTSTTTYKVSFNTNGGTGTFATQTVTSGNTASDPGDPTRSGYTFNGWYNGSSKYDFTTPVTSNLTLKAMWTANSVSESTTRTGSSDNGTSGTAGSNGKDATPSTAGPIDARYFLCLAIFLAGIAVIFYSRSTKMRYVSENSKKY